MSPSRVYTASMYAFLPALRVGLPWAPTLAALAHLPMGKFSADGRIFCTPAAALPGGSPDSCVPLCDPADSEALTLLFSGPTLVALCSSHSVLPHPAPGPSICARLLSSGQPSRFLPDYIRLKKKPARGPLCVPTHRFPQPLCGQGPGRGRWSGAEACWSGACPLAGARAQLQRRWRRQLRDQNIVFMTQYCLLKTIVNNNQKQYCVY
jgi:hypothetical protein